MSHRGITFAAVLLAGCAGILGIEQTQDEILLPDDRDDDRDATAPLDDATLPPVDPSVDAGPCAPKRVFVPFDSGPGSGVTCNPEGVLPGATAPTGLDYVGISNWGNIDGVNATACVAVEMPSAALQVRVRASATPKGCVRTCNGAYCGDEGWRAHVFASKPPGPLKWLAKIALTPTPADFAISVPSSLEATQITVCRTAANIDAEDVLVHAIDGVCVR